jgi:aldose sugar dehydrogenase
VTIQYIANLVFNIVNIDFSLLNTRKSIFIALSVGISIVLISLAFYYPFFQNTHAQPSINDDTLSVEPVVEGLSSPTSMIFLGDNDILVLEKDGQVRHVADGVLQEQPVLQIQVNAENERGLLGIATSNSSSNSDGPNTSNIFLYYTEGDPLRNRIYKYQWNGETLTDPTLILDLPAEPGPNHDGGKIVIGPDGYLYAVIGDLNHDGQLQNFPNGLPPDETGSIFRINPEDGSAASDNPFTGSEVDVLSKYYAYGIRNSFGLDFDPLTGNLWDTENGPGSFDEINLVRPGFNSGWQTVMGPISLSGDTEDDLVNFPGSQYAEPKFSWAESVAPTDIEFFSSSNLGARYANNIFVGDITTGNLYFFELNENRDEISPDTTQQQSGLSDFVVDNEDELSSITFGSGFGGITDIETGPDGSLYILSFYEGIIYKISSTTAQ